MLFRFMLSSNLSPAQHANSTTLHHCEERLSGVARKQLHKMKLCSRQATRQSPLTTQLTRVFITRIKNLSTANSVQGDCFADVFTPNLVHFKLFDALRLAMTKKREMVGCAKHIKVVHQKSRQLTVVTPSPSKGEGVGWGSRSQCGTRSSTSPLLHSSARPSINDTHTFESFFMSLEPSGKVQKTHWKAGV
jgi:hypothetical protein